MNLLLWLWAARDILRRPTEAILLGAALAALVVVAATALLSTQALTDTTASLLKRSPALVIRRLTGGGWAPMPVAEALARARSVPGVTAATARIWGTGAGPSGPVTIIGVTQSHQSDFLRKQHLPVPSVGEAVVGSGIATQKPGSMLSFTGWSSLQCRVVGVFKPQTAMVSRDVVLLHADDARRVLGIPEGWASDLTVEVFHDEEQQAVVPDLAAALPWPVRITTRSAALKAYAAACTNHGGKVALSLIPAILALAFIVVGTAGAQIRQKRETGLLKTLGWTTGDIVKLQLFRALLVGVPAVVSGFLTAYTLVFWFGIGWSGQPGPAQPAHPLTLLLHPAGTLLVLLEVIAFALLPFLLATFWAALRNAVSDPQDLLQEDSI